MKNFKKLMALVIAAVMVMGTMNLGIFAADEYEVATVYDENEIYYVDRGNGVFEQASSVTPGDFAGGTYYIKKVTTPDAPAGGKDTTIEVTGLAKGDTVNFYKIVGWVNDAADNVGGWKATADYASILDSTALALAIDPDQAGYTGITSELAGDLSRVSSTPIAAPITVGDDGKATLTLTAQTGDAELGMYMAIITPADANTVYNPVFVSADWNSGNNTWNVTEESSYYGQSAAKKSTVTLEKEFENANDYNSDDGATAAVDDVLKFTVTTVIPGYGDTFDQPTFNLKDTMDKLEYQADSIEIKDEDDNDLSANCDVTEGANGAYYEVKFKPAYLKTLKVPTKVIITYDAKVLEAAKIANINKETNTVELEFSHDPSTETTPGEDQKQYKKDKTNHYTFSIDADNLVKGSGLIGESGSELIKISVDRNGNPIVSTVKTYSNITTTEYEASPFAGAVFELRKTDGTVVGTATSDSAGRIKFENLDAGTYKLVETSAPSGYIRDTDEHTIVIDADIDDVDITEYYDQEGNWYDAPGTGRTPFKYTTNQLNSYSITFDGDTVATHTFVHESNNTEIKWSQSSSSEAPASIHNTKGVELPSTGGMGTTLFYAIGAILVLGAGILLVSKRRMAAN